MLKEFSEIPDLPKVFGKVRQINFMVEDIDAAIQQWHDKYGVGPFLVARNQVPLRFASYRGKKAPKTYVNLAFAYVGDTQLELTQLIGDTPSIYLEAKERNIVGVHHYAVCVEDFATAYNYALDKGYEAVVDSGVEGLARMSYMENLEEGLILEIIEWNDVTRPYFDGIKKQLDQSNSNQLKHEFKLSDLTPIGPLIKQFGVFVAMKLISVRS